MTRRKNRAERDVRPPLAVSHGARPPVAALCGNRLRPWLLCGMTALVVARPLFPSESAASYGDGLTLVMLWIALAVFWLLGAIGRPEFSIRFGCPDAAVLLLVGWHTVAALWAVGHGTPRPALNMLWEWVGMGLCYLSARQFIVTAREARAVAAVMVALAAGLSGYGLYQRTYELPQTRAEYAADPDRAMRDAGLWFAAGSRERELFESRLGNREPMATFALTNSLAAFLAPWLAMLVGMGLTVAGSKTVGGDSSRRLIVGEPRFGDWSRLLQPRFGDWSRLLQKRRLLGMGLCLILIATCLLLTKSRSGYIASCVGLVLVWLLCRGQPVRIGWKLPAAALGVAALLLAAALAIDGPDVFGKAWKSFAFRAQYWQSSLQMIGDHPVVGCGPGNFQNAYTQYKLPEAAEEVADPHNFLLEIWATAGTPAALAFLAVLGCFALAIMGKQGGRGKAEGGEEQEKNEQRRTRNGALSAPPSPFPLPPSSDSQSPTPNPSSDAWAYVLAGGACGFLLSIPVGLLSAAPPGVAAVLLGLPLAAGAVMLMLGWIRDGRLPRLLPAVGVVVLLVDLLAAGGIGFPSVAGTLWLLLALGLQGEQPRVFRAWGAWAGLSAAIVLAAACYHTAYSPVLSCQAQLRLAEREPCCAVEHLEAAAAADPWAAEPWRQLAAVEFERWWQQPGADAFDRFERASRKALELAPNSAPAWLAAGDWYFRAYSKMDPNGNRAADDAIQKALHAYRRAVQLYPNGELYRTKLAEAYQAHATRRGSSFQAPAGLGPESANSPRRLPPQEE